MKMIMPDVPRDASPTDSDFEQIHEFHSYVSAIWPSVDFKVIKGKDTDRYFIEATYSTEEERSKLYQIRIDWPETWKEARKRSHQMDLCDDCSFDE